MTSALDLAQLQAKTYAYHAEEILQTYKSNPPEFAHQFFKVLPELDSQVLRLLAYQLYTINVSMKDLYKAYIGAGNPQVPTFLYKLDKFPLASLLILFKYNFPGIIANNLFFMYSLLRGPDSLQKMVTLATPEFDNLEWFDFCLSVCRLLNINLNQVNASTKSTVLSMMVSNANLYATQVLLKHGVDPNATNADGTTPLEIAIKMLQSVSVSQKIYLQIVRELSKYGARVVNQSALSNKIQQNITNGRQLKPYYEQLNYIYFKLDQLEDLSAILRVNPKVLQDYKYLEQIPGTNIQQLQKAVNAAQAETQTTSKYILTWPYYIDQTVVTSCSVEPDQRPIAESPPGPTQVYEKALANLPNLPSAAPISPAPIVKEFQSTLNAPSYIPGPYTQPIFALAPKMSLNYNGTVPPLPSLE